MTGQTSSVRRLRIRDRAVTPFAARRRVEAAFAEASQRLGHDAILCVRRMTVASPRLNRMRHALEAEALGAARPAREPVPANANAVLFADRAELLACLARDSCYGEMAARWWWPALFPGQDFQQIVRHAWLNEARSIPAALTKLNGAGLASRFLARFSSADLTELWRNLVREFHLVELDERLNASEPPEAVVFASLPESGQPAFQLPSGMRAEVERILAVAILLERAPGIVRSKAFACELRARISGQILPEDPERGFHLGWLGKSHASGALIPDLNETSGSTSHLPVARKEPYGSVSESVSSLSPLKSGQAALGKEKNQAWTKNSARAEAATEKGASEPPMGREAPKHVSGRETGASPEHIPFCEDDLPFPSPPAPDRIITEWGGVFYLINVAIALGFYGDFTSPAKPGLALPLWDFLALLGGRMMGDAFGADPLAALLASLSGRDKDEPPGKYFESLDGKTLSIWLDETHRSMQARMNAALGIADADALSALVLCHHAAIEADSGRVDVHFSLAAHPIELRIAGFDRDPGWVPAGGRSIAFFYE